MKFLIRCSSVEGERALLDRFTTYQAESVTMGMAVQFKRDKEMQISGEINYPSENRAVNWILFRKFEKRIHSYDKGAKIEVIK